MTKPAFSYCGAGVCQSRESGVLMREEEACLLNLLALQTNLTTPRDTLSRLDIRRHGGPFSRPQRLSKLFRIHRLPRRGVIRHRTDLPVVGEGIGIVVEG